MLRKSGLILLSSIIPLFLSIQVDSIEPLPHNTLPRALTTLSEQVGLNYPFESLEKDNRPYKAWIAIEYENSCLKIKAFCFNNTSEDEVLRYKLQAKKNGKSGTANIFQAGPIYIPSREKKCLSQLTLRVSPEDHYWIKLEVYRDGKLIAEDCVFILEARKSAQIVSLFLL